MILTGTLQTKKVLACLFINIRNISLGEINFYYLMPMSKVDKPHGKVMTKITSFPGLIR